MGIGVGPMPTAFYEAALAVFLKKIQASGKAKKSLYDAMLRQLIKGETGRGATRQMRAIVCDAEWGWPEASTFLLSVDVEPEEDELLNFLYESVSNYAHLLYRRGQIRSLVSANLGHWIEVNVWPNYGVTGMEVSPCGRRNGEVHQPSQDLLKSLPPCEDLGCCCSWRLFRPSNKKD